jgi:hypothetical protein
MLHDAQARPDPAGATPENGFVFIRNRAERLSLMFTPRDPNCPAARSFDSFEPCDTYRQKSL